MTIFNDPQKQDPVTTGSDQYLDLADEDVTPELLRELNPMSQVTDQIFIGKRSDPFDTEIIKAAGIQSILSLNGRLEQSASELGVEKLVSFNLTDGAGNHYWVLKNAIHTLGELVQEAAPVLVHCQAGVSRSPAIVAAHLMQTSDMSFDEALELIAVNRRVNVSPDLRVEVVHAIELIRSES